MTSSAPTFPQADPAIQYIAERVSHIEDASNCTAGYYKNQKDILRRLEKTDEELTRLRGLIEGLDTRSLSQYLKESVNIAIRETQNDVLREMKTRVNPAICKMETWAVEIDHYASSLRSDMISVSRSLDDAERRLSTTAERAAAEYSEAIHLADENLQGSTKDIVARYDDLATRHADLQQRFEALLEKSEGLVPSWVAAVTVILALGFGIMIGAYLI